MPLSADDRLDLLEIIARANWAADAKDVDANASHYHPAGRITGAFVARPGNDFKTDLKKIFDGEGTMKRHALINPVFDGEGDRAKVTWLMPVFEGETEPVLVATCKVTDNFVREEGRWLIIEHVVEIDASMKVNVGQQR